MDCGLGARRQRRGHEHQPDGAGASAIHGTRAEYFLFFGMLLQITLALSVGTIASRVSLAAGFGVIAAVYAIALAAHAGR